VVLIVRWQRALTCTYTVVHRAPSPAFVAEVPYVVAIIDVDEGPHLMSRIVECAPDAVRIGMKLRAAFGRVADDTLNDE